MKRVLLSYSRWHFDPDGNEPRRFHSASIIAEGIYQACRQAGAEVTYVDAAKEPHVVAGKEFDLFVGIAENFERIRTSARCRRAILFETTSHPRHRTRILKREARMWRVPVSDLLYTGSEYAAALRACDLLLLVGNDVTASTYAAHGVPSEKIIPLNYGMDHVSGIERQAVHTPRRFLHCATDLGLRKGLNRVLTLFTVMASQGVDFRLTLMGGVSQDWARERIDSAVRNADGRITFVGWQEAHSPAYHDQLAAHEFFVFPSVEEGQAGTVLEAMAAGQIPLISRASGVDWAPLGFLDGHPGRPAQDVAILGRAATLPAEEVRCLAVTARRFVEVFHSGAAFVDRVRGIVAAVLAGSIEDVVRPPVSITLPIHNKERHARRLAFNLYGSTRSYKNIEYIVLFDGCTDKSQERFASVSRLFARRKTRVIETPNIFEVRSNNLGLKASSGKYCVLLQDDNFLFDDLWVERCVAFLERHPKVGIVGGLAGVDYFPIGTDLRGRQGQTAMSASECYQRRDPRAEPHLAGTAYEVDACMRGPLVVRKSLLERFGYLDEAFAPLYCDDMDLCLRLQSHGYLTFCLPLAVRNEELTMARYDPERQRWVDSLVSRNAALLYARWSPFPDKDRRIRVVASQFAPLADSSPAARALRLLYVMAARWWGVHARGDYLPIARHFAQSVIRRAEVAGRS